MFDKLHAEYPLLYGRNYDEKDMDERFSSLVKKHEELFNRTDIMIFSAVPGSSHSQPYQASSYQLFT